MIMDNLIRIRVRNRTNYMIILTTVLKNILKYFHLFPEIFKVYFVLMIKLSEEKTRFRYPNYALYR